MCLRRREPQQPPDPFATHVARDAGARLRQDRERTAWTVAHLLIRDLTDRPACRRCGEPAPRRPDRARLVPAGSHPHCTADQPHERISLHLPHEDQRWIREVGVGSNTRMERGVGECRQQEGEQYEEDAVRPEDASAIDGHAAFRLMEVAGSSSRAPARRWAYAANAISPAACGRSAARASIGRQRRPIPGAGGAVSRSPRCGCSRPRASDRSPC
jgi:hypothetical protein